MNQTQNVFDLLVDEIAERVVARMAANSTSQKSAVSGPRLLDVRGASEYLSVSEHSVRHQIAKGTLPVVRRGSRVFVDVRDLDRDIEQEKTSAVQ